MSDVFRHIGSDSDRRADLARTCKVPKAVLRRSVDHLVGDSHVYLAALRSARVSCNGADEPNK
jgi:hypothetical protein